MTSVVKNVGLGALLVLLAGCGAKNGAPGGEAEESGGAGNGGSTGNSEFAPQCLSYATCSEQCYCTFSDIAKCGNICASTLGSGGSGSQESGGAGNGGGQASGSGGSFSGSGGSTQQQTGSGGSTQQQTGSGGSTQQAGAGGTTATGSGGTTGTTPNTQEFDITTAQFNVPVGGNDVYKCQTFKNPTTEDIAILESDSFMSSGSHHMFVFHGTSYNTNGAMTDSTMDPSCSGVTFPSDFIHSAQTPQQSQSYPPGVGRELAPGDGLFVVVHYINLTSSPITGQVNVKFHYVPKAQVQYLANEIFLNQVIGFNVAPGQSTTSASYTTPFAMKMLGDVSHMHSRGIGFTASAGAQTLYACTTTDTSSPNYRSDCWDEPKSAVYPTGLDVPAGSSITWSCNYNNQTGNSLGFGEHAATNEMCIMSGVFYTTDMSHQGVAMTDAASFSTSTKN